MASLPPIWLKSEGDNYPARGGGVEPSLSRCVSAQEMSLSGVRSELSILGDCHLYGVFGERNVGEAKISYLKSAIEGDIYGKLRLGELFIFDGNSRFDRALGYYFIKDISEGPEGPYRGHARYYLGVFSVKNKQYSIANNYFNLASTDGSFDADYANAYLHMLMEGGLEIDADKMDFYIKRSYENQKNLYGDFFMSFPCWVNVQDDRVRPFPVSEEINNRLYMIYGECN